MLTSPVCKSMRCRIAPNQVLLALLFGLTLLSGSCDSQTRLVVNTDVPEPDREGEDWPCFLGPQGSGISTESNLLEVWPESGPPVVWSTAIGTGYSAPSVRGNRLLVHHRQGDDEVVQCLRADTGDPLWTYTYESTFRDPYGYNNGPRCSPVLSEHHCYTFGAEGKLACLELSTGEVVWTRGILEDFNVPDAFFGVGATPILEANKLIVLVGGQPNSGVVAFDAATGETLWEAVGRRTWDGAQTGWNADPKYVWTGDEMVVSYSSPIAATIHGRRHVLCLMRQGLVSVDPEDGRELFHHWFCSRTYESVNAARPVVVGDSVLLSSAYRVGATVLKVNPDGTSYDIVWSNPNNLMTHWSTAIHHEGFYYGFSGRHENEGELRCIDATTGEIMWQTTGFHGSVEDLQRGPDDEIFDSRTGETISWPFYGRGSAILADGKLIVLGERGTLALVEVNSTEWKEISRCSAPEISYPAWAAPVLSRGRMYLRDEDSLVCLNLRKPDP